jgi:5-methylcytosine-specific restriction protein B
MAFQPEKITEEHVIQAIKDIDAGDIGFRKSTKFDILYRGSTYPPKDVMRKAHEYATGDYLWIPGGGEPTNKYLKALGFEIAMKELDRFTWVDTHYELVNYLAIMENNQEELIKLLQSVGITEFNDKDENDIPLNEIDPFTFFCYLYKHGSSRRLQILQAIAEKLNLTIPKDDYGIPSANAQKVWLFPYKFSRNNNEIKQLWDLFYAELSNAITDNQFDAILKIMNVGKVKITESLFYINPQEYFPLNGPTKPYIKEVFGIESKFNSYSDYKKILADIREKTNKPFYQLSYEARLWNDNDSNINYWVFQGNPKIYNVQESLKNNDLKTWLVNTHKEKIKVGDKFILWLSGNKSGCYALGTVASEVGLQNEGDNEFKYYITTQEKHERDRVLVEIDQNFCENPIFWEDIKNDDTFKNFNGGNQGTNFTATEDEYLALQDFFNSNTKNEYNEVKAQLDEAKFAAFLTLLSDFVQKYKLDYNDERVSFNVRKNRKRIVFIVANRYAFNIKK